MLVFWNLWAARRHLKAVWQKAIGRDTPLDDFEEMIGYRPALIGLMLSVVFSTSWLWRAGMGFGAACLYVFATLVIFLGVSRIVTDVGLVFVSTPAGAQEIVIHVLGSRNLSPSSLTVLAFTNALYSYGKGLFAPALMHAAKIADLGPPSGRRRLFKGIFLAFAIGALVSVSHTLYLGYTTGAQNFKDYPFTNYSQGGFINVLGLMKNPEPADTLRLTLFGIGALVMSLLTLLKYRLPWWPFHPIGFAVAGVSYVHWTSVSVFIAWAIKSLILRIGGAMLYRRYRPFFLGVLTGYTAGIGLSLLVDTIWFPGSGHTVHGY